MLVWDEERQRYIADAIPSYGENNLEQFFERVVRDGMAGQGQGDAALFCRGHPCEKPAKR